MKCGLTKAKKVECWGSPQVSLNLMWMGQLEVNHFRQILVGFFGIMKRVALLFQGSWGQRF